MPRRFNVVAEPRIARASPNRPRQVVVERCAMELGGPGAGEALTAGSKRRARAALMGAAEMSDFCVRKKRSSCSPLSASMLAV